MVSALKKAKRRPSVLIGESNTLPYVARLTAPATVQVQEKSGGTLVAALPASDNEAVVTTAESIWSWATAAENVWETILLNYNAIDHVPPLLCNLGALEGGTGAMLLWGDGATPGVVNIIEAVDGELLAIRRALGLANGKRYADYLVEQGMTRCVGSLHEMIQGSRLAVATVSCGPDALNHRYLTEDVPYALTLAASIGAELGVATPVIDGLVAIAAAATRADWSENRRTLATWNLEGAGREGLLQAAAEGWW
jgi:opine dehydrogenase